MHIITGDARQFDLSQFTQKYGVIVADCPWHYDDQKGNDPRMGGYTYDCMTDEELCAMPVQELALPDCVLFNWGTWPKLPSAVRVMLAWGFDYVTGFPWVKVNGDGFTPRYGTGHWVAGCSEYVLIGRRGNVSPPPPPRYLGLVSPSFGHSRKPDDIHQIAETLPGPYLELFARRSRTGWTCYGNEVERVLL